MELAPRLAAMHFTLGYLLAQARRKEEARQEYRTALEIAKSIHPEYQWFWIPFLQAQINRL